ncbi:Fungalysin metallopeptidase-domain-containing protein, partial [Kickxella alabastrina]|uniref:Fungalysin metallopeptidase-domain-containing protein n=1 Tax=Kickxella alabastrina TaxID=61397 RepID=UPI00221E431F
VTHTRSQIDSLTLRQIEAAASGFGYSIGDSCTATKALIHRGDGKVVPVWHITLRQPSHWWSAHVGVKENRIESLNDWGNGLDESYRVFPRSMLSPLDGQPQIVLNPADPRGSPHGWVTANTTVGNNVWAQSNPSGHNEYIQNYRPLARVLDSPRAAVFDFPLDLSQQPTAYMDFVITQLFYTINIMHDLTFIYGFDEAAGNFQDINYSGLGAANDSIIAYAQDGRSINNALFFTPPDGQKGVMCMFIWNTNTPNRDSSLDQDIVAHEFTHGVSNRLTGGAANVDCLNGASPAAWARAGATLWQTSCASRPPTHAPWVGHGRVLFKGVHGIGEIWAVTLYDILWNLMDIMGISPDIFSHDLTKGNCAGLQIILDAMKLQPCNPSFLQARDALLQAEQNFSAGKNRCALWRGFAKRGMGPNAAFDGQRHIEDFSPPDDCKTI